jgi:hypothetical protein
MNNEPKDVEFGDPELMRFPEGRSGADWMCEESVQALNRFETQTDYLPTGERRCDHRYYDIDEYGDSVWVRCTRPAVLHVRVTPADTTMSMDGSAILTYTVLPNEAYEASACEKCYENAARTAGTEWHLAKIEALIG